MDALTITWELSSGNPSVALYFVNDLPQGENDTGFDNVLNSIRMHDDVPVTLKILHFSSLGSEQMEEMFPFKHRLEDLNRALAGRKPIYQLF